MTRVYIPPEPDRVAPARERAPMTLHEALVILTEAHTADDALTGYLVHVHPSPELWWTQAQYVEAWGVLRAELARLRAEGSAQ